MARREYVCRRCGLEFRAIAGEEEPPECPECETNDTERLELSTYGGTTDELDFTPRRPRLSWK